MPCILKIRIIAGRGLPVMDRTSELTDPYVEIRFGDLDPARTSVFRKSLNPVWNEDFRLEISDDAMLQDEPLELRVFDYDAISRDDAIGTVMLDLNPLLAEESSGQLSGWFPIYDTIKGVRGELNVQAKLQFFGDNNPFKESSAGVKFLCGNGMPVPYPKAIIFGLVDELITESDPEYHWVDSFRTSRASNEASQRLLQQLSCRLRREMGRKVQEMGGNVVFGFRECVDIEPGSRTITVRGIGTAAFVFDPDEEEPPLASPSTAPASGAVDLLSVTALPAGCVTALGGVVSARSIKLISEVSQAGLSESTEDNVREAWLNELREDIRSHARLLNCNAALGYREEIRIQDDMYLLSAEATACRVDYSPAMPTRDDSDNEEEEEAEAGEEGKKKVHQRRLCSAMHVSYRRRRAPYPVELSLCRLCRRRYVPDLILATVEPMAELASAGEPVLIDAFVLKLIRKRREAELPASAISSAMPFVEYDLHRQLLYKLRLRGYNALFGLRYSITVSGSAIVAIASGTALLLLGLPPPEPLRITRDLEVRDEEDRWLVEVQKRIVADAASNHAAVEAILEANLLHHLALDDSLPSSSSSSDGSSDSSTDTDEEDQEDRQRLALVEIDDETDEDLVLCMLEPSFSTEGFLVGNLEGPPPLDITIGAEEIPAKSIPQLVSIFRKIRLNLDGRHLPFHLAQTVHSMYREAYLQARMAFAAGPLSLRCIRHHVALSRSGEDLLIVLNGVAFGTMQEPKEEDEDPHRAQLEQEWDELISLDVSTSSSSDDSDTENRIFSRRSKHPELSIASQKDGHVVTSPGGKIQKFLIAGHMNHVELTPAAQIPASATVAHHGAVSLTVFKELHLADVPGGSPAAFTHDLLLEATALLRARVIALGGNALVNMQIRPAAFLDNLKNQIGGILHLAGDVLEVELDEPDAWSMLAHKAFYPQQ